VDVPAYAASVDACTAGTVTDALRQASVLLQHNSHGIDEIFHLISERSAYIDVTHTLLGSFGREGVFRVISRVLFHVGR